MIFRTATIIALVGSILNLVAKFYSIYKVFSLEDKYGNPYYMDNQMGVLMEIFKLLFCISIVIFFNTLLKNQKK